MRTVIVLLPFLISPVLGGWLSLFEDLFKASAVGTFIRRQKKAIDDTNTKDRFSIVFKRNLKKLFSTSNFHIVLPILNLIA